MNMHPLPLINTVDLCMTNIEGQFLCLLRNSRHIYLVIVWLNFGVCMYVYEDSTFGNFRIPYVYAYAHIWLNVA